MHSNSSENAKSTKDISPLCFILSKKLHFDSFASCGSTHKIEFAEQIHKFREHVSRNLYKGRKNVPARRVFSSEFDRKRGFDREAARKTLVFRQPQKRSISRPLCRLSLLRFGDKRQHPIFSKAFFAAICSASFLLLPMPSANTLELSSSSMVNRLSWSGPDCPARRYSSVSCLFFCTIS